LNLSKINVAGISLIVLAARTGRGHTREAVRNTVGYTDIAVLPVNVLAKVVTAMALSANTE
jgi:hypothetical protein